MNLWESSSHYGSRSLTDSKHFISRTQKPSKLHVENISVLDSVQCLSQLRHDQCTLLPHAGIHSCRNCSAHIGSWFQDPCTFIIVNHLHHSYYIKYSTYHM